MPSTQDKILFQRASSDPYGAGGEPPGEPPAPRLGLDSAGPRLSEEQVSGALEQARLRDAIGKLSRQERRQLAETMVAELADGHELPGEFDEQLLDAMLGALIAGKRGERELLGRDGVLGELTRRLVERALQEELSEHLGYPAGQAPPGGAGNSRNGGTPKTLLTDSGAVAIDTPRDGKSRFEPQLVKKGQRRLAGLDEKIIALYGGGMTTREIEVVGVAADEAGGVPEAPNRTGSARRNTRAHTNRAARPLAPATDRPSKTLPRPLQHIPAMDAIPDRVEPPARRPLGRQIQLD